MKSKEDITWEALLSQSASTFAGETAPPFGFTTRVLAAYREQQQQEAIWLRIGRRAIFASVGAVALMAVVTVARVQTDDSDPGVKSLALVEDVQVS